MEDVMSKKIVLVLISFLVLHFGCNGDNGDEDTLSDPDVPDAVDADSDDAGTEPDPVEVEEELPACPALTIAYQDFDEEPLAGLSVILEAGGLSAEGQTDSDGRVTLEGVDTCTRSAVATAVGETFAHTMTDLGPWDPAPDPLVITVKMTGIPDPPSLHFSGPLQRTQDGSSVLVSASSWGGPVSPGDSDTYSAFRYEGETNLPLSAFEYTLGLEDWLAVPSAYAFMRFDVPAEGDDGPEIVLEAAAFLQASVEITYDIATDSVFQDIAFDDMNRGSRGLRLQARDEAGNPWLAGFTTQWVDGEETDVVTVQWTEAALAEAAEQFLTLSVEGRISPSGPYCQMTLNLPPNPSDEDTFTATVYDPVMFTGVLEPDPMAFEEEHALTVAPVYDTLWFIIVAGSTSREVWNVEAPASRTNINLSSLPWPSDVNLSEFMFPDGQEADMQVMGLLSETVDPAGESYCMLYRLSAPL
jgi:hypothetical protein